MASQNPFFLEGASSAPSNLTELSRPKASSAEDSDEMEPLARRSSRKRIPSDQWELKRAIITRLYQEEKKSLKEVMEILERDYNFRATVKMFKSRIWKWGLDKKLKSDEVLAILILKRDRDAQQKPSQFTIRGQSVDLENINRYVKRNPILVARMRAGETPGVQTSLEVSCHTPPPSPKRGLPPPRESYRAEELLGMFRDCVEGNFAGSRWDWKYDVYCEGRGAGDRSDELFERVMASFALVNRCLIKGDTISMDEILNPAFESLKEIVAAESPFFVIRSVCLLWYLERHHKNNLLRLVMSYLGSLIPIVLGQHHILARIWHSLCTTPFPDYYEVSTRLYAMLVPLLEERIGPANYLTTVIYSDHIDCVLQRNADPLPLATRYRARADASGHRHPWLIELAITQTAVLCQQREAQGRLSEAIEHLRSLKSYDLAEEQDAVIDVQMGNYSYRIGDYKTAVAAYRRATRIAVAIGSDERLLMSCLSNLESGLTQQGWSLDASRVQQYRLRRIADFAAETSALVKRPHPPSIYHSQVPVLPVYTGEIEQRYAEQDVSWLWQDHADARAFKGGQLLAMPPASAEIPNWGNIPTSGEGWLGSGQLGHGFDMGVASAAGATEYRWHAPAYR